MASFVKVIDIAKIDDWYERHIYRWKFSELCFWYFNGTHIKHRVHVGVETFRVNRRIFLLNL